MLHSVLSGAAAGACGTVALNLATYLDMTARGRPASQVPGEVAERAATSVGVDLAGPPSPGPYADERQQQEQQVESRKTGSGALLGYLVGLGIGTAYGVVRPHFGGVPIPVAGAVLGLLAMASSDAPAFAFGVTNPRNWGASGWLADIVPHLAYGLVTAAAFDKFTAGPLGRRATPILERLLLGTRHSARRLMR